MFQQRAKEGLKSVCGIVVPEGEGSQIAYLILPERRMGVEALTPFQGVLVEGVLRVMEVTGGMRNR